MAAPPQRWWRLSVFGTSYAVHFELRKEDPVMDNTTLAAIIWVLAGGMLTLYLLRRRQRKYERK
jgi:lipid-A-disaccharide synthase-like uncharacterized protein